jgi:hypothetical protein
MEPTFEPVYDCGARRIPNLKVASGLSAVFLLTSFLALGWFVAQLPAPVRDTILHAPVAAGEAATNLLGEANPGRGKQEPQPSTAPVAGPGTSVPSTDGVDQPQGGGSVAPFPSIEGQERLVLEREKRNRPRHPTAGVAGAPSPTASTSGPVPTTTTTTLAQPTTSTAAPTTTTGSSIDISTSTSVPPLPASTAELEGAVGGQLAEGR